MFANWLTFGRFTLQLTHNFLGLCHGRVSPNSYLVVRQYRELVVRANAVEFKVLSELLEVGRNNDCFGVAIVQLTHNIAWLGDESVIVASVVANDLLCVMCFAVADACAMITCKEVVGNRQLRSLGLDAAPVLQLVGNLEVLGTAIAPNVEVGCALDGLEIKNVIPCGEDEWHGVLGRR